MSEFKIEKLDAVGVLEKKINELIDCMKETHEKIENLSKDMECHRHYKDEEG